MSVVISEKRRKPEKRRGRWTLADLAALPDQLVTAPVLWELWDGYLRVYPAPDAYHGSVVVQLVGILMVNGEWRGLGRISCGGVGVVVAEREPQTCFGADVVFLTKDQLPARKSAEDYLLTAPALVAEARALGQPIEELEDKAQRYLAAGVHVMWVVDPAARSVTVHRPGAEPETLGEDAALTAEGILPDLAHPVRQLFEGLE